VRTALFNWLFARHHGGTFILRIEDTDRERSTKEYEADILKSLKWMGLDWDEGPGVGGPHGPYFQLERLPKYKEAADQLIHTGWMYKCFCKSEELEARRQEAAAKGRAPRYDGRCGRLTAEASKFLEESGNPWVWRFRAAPTGETVVEDLIRGTVTFQNELMDDFVVMKSDGMPTYNFAVVVDDHDMAITHVIRGEDHLSNTPRQWLLNQAFGWTPPLCAHLSLILGSDKTRLSKRHGATAANAYEEQGILPEALVNFLALLGWSLNDKDQEFSMKELVEKFALERVSKSPAVFDTQKLEWMNGVYIRKLPIDDLTRLIWPRLVRRGWVQGEPQGPAWEKIRRIVGLEQERMKYLADLDESVGYFFTDPSGYEEKAKDQVKGVPKVMESLRAYRQTVQESPVFEATSLESAARAMSDQHGIKLKELAQAVRLALSGKTVTPPLFATMEVLGRDVCLARLDRAISQWTK